MNLGNIGDKVVVKPGYGRNYLLKTGKALRYSEENLAHVSKKKDELNQKNIELKNKLKETAKLINKKTFTFNKESKENGELYGTIKPKEISTEISNKMNVEVKPSQLVLKTNLNNLTGLNTFLTFLILFIAIQTFVVHGIYQTSTIVITLILFGATFKVYLKNSI